MVTLLGWFTAEATYGSINGRQTVDTFAKR